MEQRPSASTSPGLPRVGAVVLAGGASRRMGAHKPALEVGGRSMVARVVEACGDRPLVVVGPSDGVPHGVPVVREEPAGAGPVAGLAAGVAAMEAAAPDVLLVLAADLPFVTGAHLDALVAALGDGDGDGAAVTVDGDGRANWVCAAWRTPVLRARLDTVDRVGGLHGRSLRVLADGVAVVPVTASVGVADDVDTPEELAAARLRADPQRH